MCDDYQIIQDVLSGKTNAFRPLVDRYRKPVLSMAFNFISDINIAEDITQDVFFTAYKKLTSFDRSQCKFSTWLFTITRNKCINVLRKKKPVYTDSLPERSFSKEPGQDLETEEFFSKLDNALDGLPAKHKRAFIFAELQKLPYEEIARIEGIRIGTVRSRVHRAKQKLAHALKDLQGDIA